MRHLWLAVMLMALTTPLPAAEAPLAIDGFAAERMLYRSGEAVTFHARLHTGAGLAPAPVRVLLTVRRGCDAPLTVETKDLTIPAAGLDWTASWQPGEGQFGWLAELTATDAQGTTLASARTVVEVSGNWPEVMRLACIEPYKLASPTTSDEQIATWVARARAAGINTVETYAWMAASYFFTTDKPEWPEYGNPQPEQGRLTSVAKLKLWSRLLHENGMKLIAYNETSAVQGPDAWRVYAPTQGQPTEADVQAPYYRELGMFLPNALLVGDVLGQHLAWAIKQFDFDGLLMDSASQCMYATATGVDKAGKRLTDLSVGEVGKRYLEAARAHTRAVKPEFKYISQNAWASLVGRSWHFRRPLPAIYEAVKGYFDTLNWQPYSDAVDMWSTESDPDSMQHDRYAGTYDRLAVTLNTTREVTRKPVLLWAALSQFDGKNGGHNEGYIKPFLGTIFASRATCNDHFEMYGGTMTGPAEDAANAALRQYRWFAARYGQYLFDPALRWDQAPWEHISFYGLPSNVMWEHTVYTQALADGRTRTVINLLNLPPDRRIVAEHALPEPPGAFTMHLCLPAGAKLPRAWVISADTAGQDPVELRVNPEPPSYVFGPQPNAQGAQAFLDPAKGAGVTAWSMVVIEG